MQLFRKARLKSILSICFCLLCFNIHVTAQFLVEKDILFSDYPTYNGLLLNSLLESGIDNHLIKAHKIKSVTEWISMKDTVVKTQTLKYDTNGRMIERQVYSYGLLDATQFISYNAQRNMDSAYNELVGVNNRPEAGYVIWYDKYANPVKYINYDDFHETGPQQADSIIYTYNYDSHGIIKSKYQQLFYDEDYQPKLFHEYVYNKAGKVTVHKVSDMGKLVYTAEKSYDAKGNLKKVINKDKRNDVDSTVYYYNDKNLLGLIIKYGKHSPPSDLDFKQIFGLKYNEQGLVISKEDVVDKKNNIITYTWENY